MFGTEASETRVPSVMRSTSRRRRSRPLDRCRPVRAGTAALRSSTGILSASREVFTSPATFATRSSCSYPPISEVLERVAERDELAWRVWMPLKKSGRVQGAEPHRGVLERGRVAAKRAEARIGEVLLDLRRRLVAGTRLDRCVRGCVHVRLEALHHRLFLAGDPAGCVDHILVVGALGHPAQKLVRRALEGPSPHHHVLRLRPRRPAPRGGCVRVGLDLILGGLRKLRDPS
jgi:hypothetical protein